MARDAEALAHLCDRLQSRVGVTVTYRRGSDSVSLTAIKGNQLLRITDNNGQVRTTRTDADFIVDLADLVLNGSAIEPTRGDFIDETGSDSITRRYAVLSPGGIEPTHRMDRERKTVRIHCKTIGTV